MAMAVEQARRGVGRTSPNPPVGCVLVRDGQVLATGYHHRAGEDHAEVDALRKLGFQAEGATAYVTLEPCNHTGRTGPCTEALIAAGVGRVVVGVRDPNPRVAGQGLERLRAAGLLVDDGVLGPECEALVRPFARWARDGLPYLTLKQAATLDGAIADATGVRRLVTGPAAHERVHQMRDVSDAILVGVGTVLADDPLLNVRLPRGGRDPLRVVVDRALRTPPSARMLHSGSGAGTLLLTASDPDGERGRALRDAGAEVVAVPEGEGGVDLEAALREVAARGCVSVLCEAGPRLGAGLLRARLVDAVAWFYSPRILGDPSAPRLLGPLGVRDLDHALRLHDVRLTRLGEDFLVEGTLVRE